MSKKLPDEVKIFKRSITKLLPKCQVTIQSHRENIIVMMLRCIFSNESSYREEAVSFYYRKDCGYFFSGIDRRYRNPNTAAYGANLHLRLLYKSHINVIDKDTK